MTTVDGKPIVAGHTYWAAGGEERWDVSIAEDGHVEGRCWFRGKRSWCDQKIDWLALCGSKAVAEAQTTRSLESIMRERDDRGGLL